MLLRYICLCAYTAKKANAGVICFVNCNCCVYVCLCVAYTHMGEKEERLQSVGYTSYLTIQRLNKIALKIIFFFKKHCET